MTGNQTSHFTVSYTNGRGAFTLIYAVNKDIARKLGRTRNLLGRKPSGTAAGPKDRQRDKVSGRTLDNYLSPMAGGLRNQEHV